MNLKLLLTAALAVVACAAPAAAGAATIFEDNGTIVYRGEGSEGLSLLISDRDAETWGDEPKPRRLSFSDSGADRFVVSTPLCWDASSAYGKGVECQFSDSRPIRVEGSAAKDDIGIFSANDVPDSIPIEIDGRGGDDTIKDAYNGAAGRIFRGGDGADTIYGYSGNDRIFGDAGNDPDLDGGDGDDEVRGGDGDDELYGDRYQTPGADIIDGGNGTDLLDGEWTIPAGSHHPPATVSLDGQPNDGRPGENDNVTAVEKINGYVSMTFVGTDAGEVVDMVNPAEPGTPNDLRGMGGNDRLVARDAADTVDGGAGDDHVEGGYNHDTVTGGPGKDMIFGDKTGSQSCWYSCTVPFGNDTIQARDGEADTIDCGVGEDTAVVDAIDTVANCESVQRAGAAGPGLGVPGPGTGPGPGGPAPGGPGTGKDGSSAGATVALAGARRLGTLTKGKLAATVACAAACKVTASLTIGGKKVASGSSTLLAAGTVKAKLKVAKSAARQLKRMRKATATLRVTIESATGKHVVTRKVALAK